MLCFRLDQAPPQPCHSPSPPRGGSFTLGAPWLGLTRRLRCFLKEPWHGAFFPWKSLFCPSRRQATVGTGSGKAKVRGQEALRPGLAESAGCSAAWPHRSVSRVKALPSSHLPGPGTALMESRLLNFKLSRKDTANHHCRTIDGRCWELSRLAGPLLVGQGTGGFPMSLRICRGLREAGTEHLSRQDRRAC